MQEAKGVRIVRAGRRTYFIDSLRSKKGNPYLKITESLLVDGERNEHQRSKILIFGEVVKNFAREVTEAAKSI